MAFETSNKLNENSKVSKADPKVLYPIFFLPFLLFVNFVILSHSILNYLSAHLFLLIHYL